jgi:CheY-like chemotaxis protein
MSTNDKVIDVLLVEDDKINQMVVCAFLRKWGMRVTVANDGKEAVMHILEKRFQIVLMDLQMPQMDGLEATTIIRSMDDLYFKTVPILVFTAHVISHVKRSAIEHGVTDLLSKPFEPVELRKRIDFYSKALPKTRTEVLGSPYAEA